MEPSLRPLGLAVASTRFQHGLGSYSIIDPEQFHPALINHRLRTEKGELGRENWEPLLGETAKISTP
jgi:hypothetical protein